MHEKWLHPFLQVQTVDTYFSLTLLQYKGECCMKKPYTTEQRNLHQNLQSQMMRFWNLDPIVKITNHHRHSHQNRNLHHLFQKGTCWPPSSTYLIKTKRTSQLSMGEASCRPFTNPKKKKSAWECQKRAKQWGMPRCFIVQRQRRYKKLRGCSPGS